MYERVAVITDVHGNAPALRAVLAEVDRAGVDALVCLGDLVAGPLPRECMALLDDVGVPLIAVRGNADREVVEAVAGTDGQRYPMTEATAELLGHGDLTELAQRPLTVTLAVLGLDRVLACHATPRNDEEVWFATTAEDVVARVLSGVDADVVLCGHTHMAFDRVAAGTRIVNPGSVGMPFDTPGAHWALLADGDVHLRVTSYDTAAAAAEIRASGWRLADDFVTRNVQSIPEREQVMALFGPREVTA